jgi:hypothetical protein
MDGIGKQAYAATQEDNHQLKQGGHGENHQRDFECPDATSIRQEHPINVRLSMAMPMEKGNCVKEPTQRIMAMFVIVIMERSIALVVHMRIGTGMPMPFVCLVGF